jgi:hypothetical protein
MMGKLREGRMWQREQGTANREQKTGTGTGAGTENRKTGNRKTRNSKLVLGTRK